MSDTPEPELCLSLPDARRAVVMLEQHDLLLERVNLLESKLSLREKQSRAQTDAAKLCAIEVQDLREAVHTLKRRSLIAERQAKRAKRGRVFWGTFGFVGGALITGLLAGLLSG